MWLLVLWQILSLIVVLLTWKVIHGTLLCGNAEYRDLPYLKKIYVTKNISKGLILSALSPIAARSIVQVAFHNEWNTLIFQGIGAVYISSDVVGLALLREHLNLSTILHHIVVTIFGVKSLGMNYGDEIENGLLRNIGMLGAFSTLTGVVNIYLGMRHIASDSTKDILRKLSVTVYFPCILASCAWQFVNAAPYLSMNWSILYFVALAFIFYDDYVLMRFLSRNQSQSSLIALSTFSIPIIMSWYRSDVELVSVLLAFVTTAIANDAFQNEVCEVLEYIGTFIVSGTCLINSSQNSILHFLCATYFTIMCLSFRVSHFCQKYVGENAELSVVFAYACLWMMVTFHMMLP